MRSFRLLNVLLLVSGWGLAAWLGLRQPPAISGPLPREIDSTPQAFAESGWDALFGAWASDPGLAGAAVGFCLLDSSGELLYGSPLAATAMCPASALKTLTTGAGLGILGPGFRFETALASTAKIGDGGLLAGDLVLVGGGDPTLTLVDLERLADELAAAGLRRVDGRLRVDVSVFPANPASDHWNWGDVGNAYGAGAFGVNVEHNRLVARFDAPARVGGPAALAGIGPLAKDTAVTNHVVAGPPGSGDGVVIYSEPGGSSITLRGTVPGDSEGFAVSGAIPDPPRLALEHLRSRLEAAGVTFSEKVREDPGSPMALVVDRSATLAEILPHLHRVSDNLEAQCLFLMLGRKQGKAAPAAVREFWEAAGVEFSGLRLIDGSGLARANMIRPLDLARVNHIARGGGHGRIFEESLGGEPDGVRSKIGGMSGVRTEVGFLRLADGRDGTFALMANGLDPRTDFRALRGKLLSLAASEGGSAKLGD